MTPPDRPWKVRSTWKRTCDGVLLDRPPTESAYGTEAEALQAADGVFAAHGCGSVVCIAAIEVRGPDGVWKRVK